MTRLISLALVAVLLFASGCAMVDMSPTEPVPSEVAASDLPRNPAEDVPGEDLDALVEGHTAFALELYDLLRQDRGNLVFSPYSISLALGMTYAGARGETEVQMAEALYLRLQQERLHAAANALDQILASRGENAPPEMGTAFALRIANALWAERTYGFEAEFLDTLALHYGAAMHLADFSGSPDGAREMINRWVEEQTEERIQELLPEGSVDPLTRLVLANAIYMKASWLRQFPEHATSDAPFYLSDGSEVQVPTMRQTAPFHHIVTDEYTAISLPYIGDELAMLLIMPEDLAAFEAALDPEALGMVVDALSWGEVNLAMPRFRIETSAGLADALKALGMTDAFIYGDADLSGMDGTRELYVTAVQHKAFIDVDEEGTEAAAATAVVVGTTSMPLEPVDISLDRPFLFAIRDRGTGAVLFMGRVMDPR